MFSIRAPGPYFSLFLIGFFSILATLGNLGAQEEPTSDLSPAHPYFGLVVGAGGLPAPFHYGCSDYSEDSGGLSESLLGGFFFGLPLGPFHLETRTFSRRELGNHGCILLQPVFQSGIHTERSPLAETGTQNTSDLRIGYGLPFRLPVVASVGAGWVWGNNIPYLGSGLGIRTTGKLRLTVDLFWEMFRMPFRHTAQEWEDFELVRAVGVSKKHDWQHAWSFQVGIAGYIR